MTRVNEMLAKARAEGKSHPTWDHQRCDRYSKKYERAYAYERNRYLRTLSDLDSITLESRDAYDRLELIRHLDNPGSAQAIANGIKSAIEAPKNGSPVAPLVRPTSAYENASRGS